MTRTNTQTEGHDLMHYSVIHQILLSLETKVGISPPKGSPRPIHVRHSLSPVQGFALSDDTAGRELPVVVAVGANYTQGKVKCPRDASPPGIPVEDDLKSCRRQIRSALSVLNSNWVDFEKSSISSIAFGDDFHLVMTNFCLWNTDTRWQNIDPKLRANLLDYNPTFSGGTTSAPDWPHLAQLHAALASSSPLWIAHGIHSEVFSLFQPFAALLGLNRWMMTPNLSYRYFHYGKCYPRP